MGGCNGEKITRVLFCGLQFPSFCIYTKQYLRDYPFIQVDEVPITEVPNVIENYDICVTKAMKIDSNVISHASKLKLMMQCGVGLEGIDIEATTKSGIKVARIPSNMTENAISCAELSIYLILGLLQKQNQLKVFVKQKKTGEQLGETLLGKTVFILGFGNIGIELAKRLQPFGVRIIATKRIWKSHSQCFFQPNGNTTQSYAIEDLVDEKGNHGDINEFAGKADIVVCCLNMNAETAGTVNKSFISFMKKVFDFGFAGSANLVGMSSTKSTLFTLYKKKKKITPHVGGGTIQSYLTTAKILGDVALQFHAGSPWTGIEIVN